VSFHSCHSGQPAADVETSTLEHRSTIADIVRRAALSGLSDLRPGFVPHADGTRAAPPGLSKWRLRLVASYVAEHLGDKVTLANMAAAARLSRMHFAALFVRATGLRPHDYLLRQRIAVARELLRSTERPIVEIALSVGFQTQAHFTTVFKRVAGSTPARWRERRTVELRHR
jgi:AraC family transcriptional regulator